jgi:hypothetical protein
VNPRSKTGKLNSISSFSGFGTSISRIVDAIKLVEDDLATLDPARQHNFTVVYTPSGTGITQSISAASKAWFDLNAHAVVGDYTSRLTLRCGLGAHFDIAG